jgi:RNA polymerase sigma factor FliA
MPSLPTPDSLVDTSTEPDAGDRCEPGPADDTVDPIAVLWERYRIDKPVEIRNLLVEHYMPLARFLADKVKARLPVSVDVDDLISAGAQGLMSAVEAFDPDYGVKFETYCSQRVKGAMLDELRHEDWATRQLRQRATKLQKTESALSRTYGRPPTEQEMADELELDVEEYRAMARSAAAASRLSLQGADADADESGARGIVLEDRRVEEPWAGLTRQDVFKFVTRDLQPKERMIITLYYYEQLTMKEIGGIFGVTESRVCQIHKRILKQLRTRLAGQEHIL